MKGEQRTIVQQICNLRFWRPLEHICCLPLPMRCDLALTEVVVSEKIVGRLVGKALV